MTLREIITQEIRDRGPIPFSRYMELCLYHPEFGFYSCNIERFGKAGDFYTSSDVHAVFGRLLARQFEEIWRVLGSPGQMEILELGPGRGLFGQDVLDWSERKFPEFFQALHYSLVERSPVLQRRLRESFAGRISDDKVSVTDSSHYGCIPRIIFANEFFDAFPVEVVGQQGELLIDEQQGRFLETWAAAGRAEVEFLDRYSVHPEAGERLEVPLAAQSYMLHLAKALETGFLVVIDYGYTRPEQLAGRHRGTLMAYRQHSVSTNPYEAPGDQDITAHVNFSALAAAAEAQGLQVRPLVTQSQFLLGIGEKNQFADAFDDCRQPQERAKVALQLKHLVTPAGMGETFHVLVGSKGVSEESGSELMGLSFGKGR